MLNNLKTSNALIILFTIFSFHSASFCETPKDKKYIKGSVPVILEITVGIVNGDNTVTYIPKQNFAISSQSYETIFKSTIKESFDDKNFVGINCENYETFLQQYRMQIETVNSMTQDVIEICETGFSGKCQVTVTNPGYYYIWPIAPVSHNSEFFHWDLGIKIHPGKNTVELSNNNTSEHPSILFYRITKFLEHPMC
jgi:hypothetical protein